MIYDGLFFEDSEDTATESTENRHLRPQIFAADKIGLSLLAFTRLFSKSTQNRRICAKSEFNVKWLFKVIQYHVLWGRPKWKANDGLHIAI